MLTAALPFRRSRSRAFGLLEVILVFALILGAGAITFSVFASAKGSADADQLAQQMNLIAANLRTVYVNHDYAGLNTDTAVKSGAVPPAMIQDGVPTTAYGPITISAFFSNSRQVDINFNYVPSDGAECSKLLATLAQSADDLLVAGSGPEDIGGSVKPGGKLDMDQVGFWCSGAHTSDGSTVGIDLITH